MNEIVQHEPEGRQACIPMALGQDTFFGYTTDLLVKYKVRWIEIAAVMPMWTNMIAYYVEGHAGHLMNAEVGKAEWRSNVKGQCFSFIMPWAQLIREFKQRCAEDDLLQLPRSEHTLQYLFRIHLKVAGQSFTEELQQVRLRPWVLCRLLEWLWTQRPDLFPRKSQEQRDFIAEIKQRVATLYPEKDGHLPEEERPGHIPPVFQRMLRRSGDSDGEEEMQEPPRKTTKFFTDAKNATPGSVADASIDAAINNSEPRCCILDGDNNAQISEAGVRAKTVRAFAGASADGEEADGAEGNDAIGNSDAGVPDAAAGGGGERVKTSTLELETGCDMQEQWTGAYVSQALPFIIPRLISGPTFFPTAEDVAAAEAASRPLLTITAFLHGFVRRVENLCHADWTAVPVLRSLWFKYTSYTSRNVQSVLQRQTTRNLTTHVSDHIQAMQKLARTLDKGVVGRGVLKIPVAGDVSRLPFAEGLTEFERRLAREIVFKASTMPGTLPVRRLMGHCGTGARVNHGEALFLTWSPNEQQSALVLRLMRNRAQDPMLQGDSAEDAALREMSTRDAPAITEEANDSCTFELPLYHTRRKLTARDPRAVVAAYTYEVKFKLPWLLGLRACPYCPHCNVKVEGHVLRSPCQDIFGTNTLPMGGLAGLAATMGGSTEFQKKNTPHLHAHVHLVNAYQYGTMAEIAEAITKGWLDPQSITRFSEWLHVEDTLDAEQYDADKELYGLMWFHCGPE